MASFHHKPVSYIIDHLHSIATSIVTYIDNNRTKFKNLIELTLENLAISGIVSIYVIYVITVVVSGMVYKRIKEAKENKKGSGNYKIHQCLSW